MKKKQEKRSPLKDKPLRSAGQSLDDEIYDKWGEIIFYISYSLGMIFLIIYIWANYFLSRPISPLTMTLIVAGYCVYAGFKINKTGKEIKLLKMARDGEKIVAEELQALIKDGAAVLNDIVSDNFNIDHVVISSHGIFLIETKTYSKPIDNKEAKITFDEDHIFVDGKKYDRNPIEQVRALTKWLQDLIKKSTGIKFQVKPVILFPGWFTEPIKRGQDIWILNPKALPKFVSNEPITLKDTEVHLITFHLSRYIRTFEPKR